MVDKELDIILDIMSKSGTNEKIDTIKQNEDNERLKQILFYTFNPLYVFGISSKKIEKELNMILPFETDDLLNSSSMKIVATVRYFSSCSLAHTMAYLPLGALIEKWPLFNRLS